jgi:hypothetical protein
VMQEVHVVILLKGLDAVLVRGKLEIDLQSPQPQMLAAVLTKLTAALPENVFVQELVLEPVANVPTVVQMVIVQAMSNSKFRVSR